MRCGFEIERSAWQIRSWLMEVTARLAVSARRDPSREPSKKNRYRARPPPTLSELRLAPALPPTRAAPAAPPTAPRRRSRAARLHAPLHPQPSAASIRAYTSTIIASYTTERSRPCVSPDASLVSAVGTCRYVLGSRHLLCTEALADSGRSEYANGVGFIAGNRRTCVAAKHAHRARDSSAPGARTPPRSRTPGL